MTKDSKEKEGDAEKLDGLLARAEELKRRAQQGSNEARKAGTAETISETLTSINDNLSFFRRLTYNVAQGGLGFYQRFLAPVLRVVGPPLLFLVRWYGRLWNRVVYRRKEGASDPVLSRGRAGVMVAVTIAAVAAFTPTRIGDAVRFISVEPVVDGLMMAISKRTETFYLNNSEEIDPLHNVHAVRGCKSAGSCSEADAAYFRIRPRLSHDIWKFVTYGNPIYVPDHVVAPIAPGVNKCEVTYYGYRMTSSWISRLMRSFEVYPTLLETTCTFVGSGKSEGAVAPRE